MKTTLHCNYASPRLADAWNICGNSAYFEYQGFKPGYGTNNTNNTNNIASGVRGAEGQIIELLCLEHTRRVMNDMEPALVERQVTVRCVVQTVKSIRCSKCKSVTRINMRDQWPSMVAPREATDLWSGNKGDLAYCPICGAQAISLFDPDADFWELLARELGIPDIPFLKRAHALWVEDAYTSTPFVQYINEMLREIKQANALEAMQ